VQSNKVYLAECTERGNDQVAIKQIDLPQQSVDTKEKITKEVQGMNRVTCSEFVVQFHCSFVFEEQLWIVMELQEGSVRDVLKWKFTKGIDDERIIASILFQTLQGINFLHEQRIIHRDIKAGNLLYNKEGNIKLADFGVSAILDSHDQRRTTMAGTFHWMAPEVIDPSECGGYDYKADIWSFGITCIELAYSVPPYSDVRPAQVMVNILQHVPPTLEKPRVKDHTIKKFSVDFKDFVEKCLQVDPKRRPTAAKLLTHKLFQVKADMSRLKQALMGDLPSIGERFQEQANAKRKIILHDLNIAGFAVRPSSGPVSGSGGAPTMTVPVVAGGASMGLDKIKSNSKGEIKKMVVNTAAVRMPSLSKSVVEPPTGTVVEERLFINKNASK